MPLTIPHRDMLANTIRIPAGRLRIDAATTACIFCAGGGGHQDVWFEAHVSRNSRLMGIAIACTLEDLRPLLETADWLREPPPRSSLGAEC